MPSGKRKYLDGFPPYTEADWIRDRQAQPGSLSCIDCHHDEDFGPRKRPGENGISLHYQACKVCGFWQYVDAKPFRCRLMRHICPGVFKTRRDCGGCGNRISPGVRHPCVRVVEPDELFCCPECQTDLTPAYVIPWPVERD